MTKKKKKKRLRVGRIFLLFIILAIAVFSIINFVDVPIRSIYISGNKILSDQEVIEIAKLEDYPSFFGTLSLSVKQKISKSPYVDDVKVSKGILSIKIKITEKKVLYVDKETNEKITNSSKIKDDKILCVPYLINEVPEKKQKRFIKAMEKIDEDMLCQMSEIKYDPNEIDEDRYYVYMNDGNNVYLTVNKFDKINKYNSILENVGKQNGTLYLDYGDYFEVK